ncbi:uncharacterized protein [Palaemon carinicauda]|uniref:uncharacterized protein n=1 Tax=Palaemon carinicauda TaxID=392227 RepID=UPI0035B65759
MRSPARPRSSPACQRLPARHRSPARPRSPDLGTRRKTQASSLQRRPSPTRHRAHTLDPAARPPARPRPREPSPSRVQSLAPPPALPDSSDHASAHPRSPECPRAPTPMRHRSPARPRALSPTRRSPTAPATDIVGFYRAIGRHSDRASHHASLQEREQPGHPHVPHPRKRRPARSQEGGKSPDGSSNQPPPPSRSFQAGPAVVYS